MEGCTNSRVNVDAELLLNQTHYILKAKGITTTENHNLDMQSFTRIYKSNKRRQQNGHDYYRAKEGNNMGLGTIVSKNWGTGLGQA